jgi:DnaJ family protein B protein 11
MAENYYNILGLEEGATKDEIKKAYRSLSFKFHPDKNPGNLEATGKFQKINEAYETLGDEQKREEYDMSRKNPFIRMNSTNGMDIPMDDIFNMFFNGMGNPFAQMSGMGGMPNGMGGMPGFPPGFPPGVKVHVFNGGPIGFQQALQKPSPIIKNVTITLEQILTGATVPLEIERWIVENGMKVFENETVYVTIPQGIDDGEMIILREKGNIINETAKGDIKIFVKVKNETLFKRSGLDLILEKNITLKESLCGFSFEIKYVNGKSYTLNNNKGNIIPPEYRKIYPNMGLKREEHTGNMIIHFHVDFPEKLTDEQIGKLSEVL